MMRKISSSESSCREAKGKMKEKYLKANFSLQTRGEKLLKEQKNDKKALYNRLIVKRERIWSKH